MPRILRARAWRADAPGHRRQRVAPGEARLVDGNAEELGPFVLCQQLSAAHGAEISDRFVTPVDAL